MSDDTENPWDKNFKIPKRKADEISNCSNSDYIYNSGSSLANNSYYEYYNQYTQAQWQQTTAYPQHYYTPQGASAITQNICNTLSSIKEKPKNYQRNTFKDTVPDISDATLPKELTSQFQPLFCKLCTSQLSSNVTAKLHYKSKNHEKKVRKFLVEYAEKTGTPVHKRVAQPKTEEKETNPRWFHCIDCDLPLTGKMHAESHYMGKNHQKVVMGYKMPAGNGSYDADGKWIRRGTKKLVCEDGEDTFGQDFKKLKKDTGVAATPESTKPAVPNQKPAVPNQKPAVPNQVQGKFHCSICYVGTTCQEQLDIHYQGQKHKKKLRQLGMLDGTEALQDSADQATPHVNLSVYRTPSGDYYCPTCNITLSSGCQFKLHVKGKQHAKKVAQK